MSEAKVFGYRNPATGKKSSHRVIGRCGICEDLAITHFEYMKVDANFCPPCFERFGESVGRLRSVADGSRHKLTDQDRAVRAVLEGAPLQNCLD